MALTKELCGPSGLLVRRLQHAYQTEAAGAIKALVTGVAGKRIRIHRLVATCDAAAKSCQFLSGTNPFITLHRLNQSQSLKSSDGVPVFTCNAGESFNADPSDATAWYFYVVYSIE